MMNQTKYVYNLVATLVRAVHKVKYYVVHQMEWNGNGSNLIFLVDLGMLIFVSREFLPINQ